MVEVGKRLLIFVVGNLVICGIASAASNLMDGKDILGRKKKAREQRKTKMDWRGNIVLGTLDYEVV